MKAMTPAASLQSTITQCQLLLLTLLLMALMAPAAGKAPAGCYNRLELMIVVDTATSETAGAFDQVKAAVKAIVSGIIIDDREPRLGLVSVSGQSAQVVATFLQVRRLADFSAAVDRLAFSAGASTASDLAAGMQAARQQMSPSGGTQTRPTSRVLLLVKDRRRLVAAVADAAARGRIAAEAAAAKSAGIAVQAIGTGGIWVRDELVALFGTDYLLFKDRHRATSSVKSLNNLICQAECPDQGQTFVRPGLCHAGSRMVATTAVQLAADSTGFSVCRRVIDRSFEGCSSSKRCNKMDRMVGQCTPSGRVTVTNTWESFDFKTQECITNKAESVVDCKDSLRCTGHVADVIYILDRSSSMFGLFEFMRRATQSLMQPLDVGPSGVRVGLMIYENVATMVARLGSVTTMPALLAALNSIPSLVPSYGFMTQTDRALTAAIEEFKARGRSNVPRFVFLITDGGSTTPERTFRVASEIKNYGVTLFVMGVGNVNVSELEIVTAPETATNLFLLADTAALEKWAAQFASLLCIRMAAPDPKLCEENEFVQAISTCAHGMQQITRTDYIYDSARQCIKSIHSRLIQGCKSKCIDPITGNEYFEGDSWQTRCHDFVCSRSPASPFVPQKSHCISADRKCQPVSSARFKCVDDQGVQSDNCQCVQFNGRPTVVVEKL